MEPKIVQAVVAPAFLLLGLSHLLQPQLWVRFYEVIRQSGLGAIIIPIYTLPLALVLVVGHNVWKLELALLLTIAGWGMLLKCTLYLLVPGFADRMLATKMARSPSNFQIAGAVLAILGAVLTWQVWGPS